jgi:hypothetical protein
LSLRSDDGAPVVGVDGLGGVFAVFGGGFGGGSFAAQGGVGHSLAEFEFFLFVGGALGGGHGVDRGLACGIGPGAVGVAIADRGGAVLGDPEGLEVAHFFALGEGEGGDAHEAAEVVAELGLVASQGESDVAGDVDVLELAIAAVDAVDPSNFGFTDAAAPFIKGQDRLCGGGEHSCGGGGAMFVVGAVEKVVEAFVGDGDVLVLDRGGGFGVHGFGEFGCSHSTEVWGVLR